MKLVSWQMQNLRTTANFNVQLQKRRASSMMWEQLASAVTLVEPFHKLSIVLSPQSSDSSITENYVLLVGTKQKNLEGRKYTSRA
jgi:hypothetical protein